MLLIIHRVLSVTGKIKDKDNKCTILDRENKETCHKNQVSFNAQAQKRAGKTREANVIKKNSLLTALNKVLWWW